jgi:hypothetical protein
MDARQEMSDGKANDMVVVCWLFEVEYVRDICLD